MERKCQNTIIDVQFSKMYLFILFIKNIVKLMSIVLSGGLITFQLFGIIIFSLVYASQLQYNNKIYFDEIQRE